VTLADVTLLAFTTCNTVRVVAYLPQIWKVATDPHGARAISFVTWGLFLASNVATVAYAWVNRGDAIMAALFVANGAGCLTVLALAAWQRAPFRHLTRPL
jgi:hypothetical protein